MSNEQTTMTFVDPETGDEDEVTFETHINGWQYNPDSGRAAIVWQHPETDGIYVGWEKTGGQAWSAWINIPGKIPRDTIFNSFASPKKALHDAERIMQTYSPSEAESREW